jgi:hypothetical protein
MSLGQKIEDVLVSIDETAAAVLFNGEQDITISSRCGMALLDGGPVGHKLEDESLKLLAAGLDDLQKDHCFSAIVDDYNRAAKIIALLNPYMVKLVKVGFIVDNSRRTITLAPESTQDDFYKASLQLPLGEQLEANAGILKSILGADTQISHSVVLHP